MNRIALYLNRHLSGNIFDKMSVRKAYSTDQSVLTATPRFVALPTTTTDIRKLVRFSHQLSQRKVRLPITVRGGGHDKTGAAIGSGIVISMEKMNRIIEIDPRNRLVHVQAGITLGELNTALAVQGLTIPIAGHDDHTIGGLIGNAPTDDYASRYGGIFQCVEQVEVVLSNSDLLQTEILRAATLEQRQAEKSLAGNIYCDIDDLLRKYANIIGELQERELDSAGYSPITLVQKEQTFDLLPLFFTAQGTLGIVSEVILRCIPLPKEVRHILITCKNIRTAVNYMEYMQKYEPLSLNLYDPRIFADALRRGRKSPLFPRVPKDRFVILASFNHAPWRNRRILDECIQALPRQAHAIIEDENNTNSFQALPNFLTSYLNDDIRGERAPLIDDVRIPTEQLASFVAELTKLEKVLGVPLAIFGSFATSNYQVRPELKLDSVAGRQLVLRFLKAYSKLVQRHQGSITGGSPEGSVKTMVSELPTMQRKLYQDIKHIFDSQNILNPHVKLGASTRTSIRRLRSFYNRGVTEL